MNQWKTSPFGCLKFYRRWSKCPKANKRAQTRRPLWYSSHALGVEAISLYEVAPGLVPNDRLHEKLQAEPVLDRAPTRVRQVARGRPINLRQSHTWMNERQDSYKAQGGEGPWPIAVITLNNTRHLIENCQNATFRLEFPFSQWWEWQPLWSVPLSPICFSSLFCAYLSCKEFSFKSVLPYSHRKPNWPLASTRCFLFFRLFSTPEMAVHQNPSWTAV